ncbi:N-acetylmuramoyl-L-alanine amidase family protein [Thermovibrio ammonificans]|jgi:N-acetylmuramoyl-L-alanine amidase
MLGRREALKLLLTSPLLLVGEAVARSRPVILRVRYSATRERTRIVLDCTGKVERSWIKEHFSGNTLWLTFKGVGASRRMARLLRRSPLVREVEVIPVTHTKTRVKVVMREPHKFKIFGLRPCGRRPFRVVIDVFPDYLPIECAVRKVPQRIVVIDPGHGGKDPGAVWPIGSKHPRIEEKWITLAIALKVRKYLSRNPNIKVVMTRTRDVYVPLLKRAEIAAKVCADAFVSIHADSMPNYPNWSGVTVFKASPALFAKAQQMARKVAKNVRMCSDTMCWSISPLLINLSTTVTFAESAKLARAIVESLKAHVNDELINGIKDMRRNIVVLKTPGRPAVLIESGFITNPLDRKRLVEPWYQDEIARGIARGIEHYLDSLNAVAYLERRR